MQNKFNELVAYAVERGASDIHISEGRAPRVRVDSRLVVAENYQATSKEQVIEILRTVLVPSKREIFEKNHEVDFAYMQAGNRFRANAYVQQGRIGLAMRHILPRIRTVEELLLPPILSDFTRLPQGFFLVVGPVGQGKSTTLAAMIDVINRERSEHIITIEDPVEYLYEDKRSLIEQREVGADTRSFNSALISALRQDVDVLLVGEMRDAQTMATALTAAETGHLVFSTLHTNNAGQTIDRIIDSFQPEAQGQVRSQLSLTLTGIFSQRLIPRIEGGMVPAYELLINNNAISNLIREGRVHEISSVIETSSDMGMIDMNRSLADLVRRGEIESEVALSRSLDPENLRQLM